MDYRIVSRAEAGLAKPRRAIGKMKLPVREVWLHHTVTRSTADALADWRHVQETGFGRGFVDISYSYGFHQNGTILEGRGDYVGAHTADRNSSSYGLVLIGNYENLRPTPEQINAVRWWVKWAKDTNRVVAGAYPSGGHRDLQATACPGRYAYEKLPEFRMAWQPASSAPIVVPKEGIVAVNRPPVTFLVHPDWPVADPTKPPYLVVTDDGGVFSFGGAPFFGSLGGVSLNAPIIEAKVTPTGQGYVMLGRDGGIFPFGDAPAYYASGRVEFAG